jgi:hypothetical protein
MAEPVSGAAGKVAGEMVKEVQTALREAEQLSQTQKTQPTTQFNEVLANQQVGQTDALNATRSTNDVIRAATEAQRSTVAVPATGRALDSAPTRSGWKRLLNDIMSGQDKYGEIMRMAMSGREFSNTELLALQAGVYRFSQELELTSKVVEKGTSAIKQTLNTQV